MSDRTRPTLDPEPENTGVDFTATATASPEAWQRLSDNLDRINAGFAARDAAEEEGLTAMGWTEAADRWQDDADKWRAAGNTTKAVACEAKAEKCKANADAEAKADQQ